MADPASWGRIETLLDELLELGPNERGARLDRLSGPDAELRPELERLLDADAETTAGILDRGMAPLAGRVLAGDEDGEEGDRSAPAGARVGPYRVVRELGRGGMGEVLLAERADGDFDQLVALKVIRQGLHRSEIVERFRHERRILARLRHPNIAALYDGGATEDGAPYFAMEYVEGTPIHEYCDDHRLTIDQRIRLFDSVCRAVQHAHRNLVVHRDLKPSNVLVTADGTAKLLDFGIAKVVESEGDAGDSTRTAGFLTPAFAAPEQVAREPTSTATDVYALGVLLYVLLTGHNPHGETSRSFDLAKAILEQDTPDPSSVVGRGTTTETGEEIARRRGTAPSDLRRKIRGDLDNILRKALQKKPEDRYATVEDFRADLERHRRALPVSVRNSTAAYRFGRFARRNRVGVAAAGIVAISLLVGLAGVLWQSDVAARERDQAEAVKGYMIAMFTAADPAYESGESLTALQIVERGAESVSRRFQDEPEIRAEVTQILGTVMSRLAQYDRADSLLKDALAAHRRHGDVNREGETLVELGDVARWQGRLDDADSLATEAIATLRKRGGEETLVAYALGLRGAATKELGRYEESFRDLEEAISIARAAPEADEERVARYLEALASAHAMSGDIDGGVALLREAKAIHEAREDEVGVARTLVSMGDMLDDLDRPEEAEEALRSAVRVLRREYGDGGHPQLAIALGNLGGFLRGQNRVDEAEPIQRESVEMFRRHLGDDHYFVARALNNLSLTLARKGDMEGSIKLLEQAVDINRRALGPRHPALVAPLTNLGNKNAELERWEEAEPWLREAREIAMETQGPDHYELSHALVGLGNVTRHTDRLDESEALFRRAYEIRRDALGQANSRTVWSRREVAVSLDRLGRTDEAEAEFAAAIKDGRDGLPATQRELSRALYERGLMGEEHGQPADEIAPFFLEAFEIRRDLYGEDSDLTIEAREALERVAPGER